MIVGMLVGVFFFFKQKTAYEMRISDWSSDVCSSDLLRRVGARDGKIHQRRKGAKIGLLFEHHDMRAGDDHPLALVGVDLPGEQLEQSRLARAVAADQRQPVARPDLAVDILEQPAAALHTAEAFIS